MDIVYCFADSEEFLEIIKNCKADGTEIVPLEVADWNRDLTPWPAAKAFPRGKDFAGGAEDYLIKLEEDILKREQERQQFPERRFLVGYSLAGLFSVYAALQSRLFYGIASVSGSLWYDDFWEYVEKQPIVPGLHRAYFSLGNREKNAADSRMRMVESRTQAIEESFRIRGVDTIFETNPGGHFQEPEKRMARGIRWLLEEDK